MLGGECAAPAAPDVLQPSSDGPQLTGNGQTATQPASEQVLGYTPQVPLANAGSRPDGLVLVISPPDQIALTWTDNSTDETNFKIQRNANYGGWLDLATVDADSTQYVDSSVASGGRYGYRVVAFNGTDSRTSIAQWTTMPASADMVDPQSGGSSSGNSSSTGTLPAAPTGVALVLTPEGQVQLSWTDTAADETGFAIWRYTTDGGWVNYAQVGADSTQYVDTAAEAGKSYCYRVRAVNDSGSSGAPAPKCIAVPTSKDQGDNNTPPNDSCPSGNCPPAYAGPKILPWLEINGWWLIFNDTWGPVEGSEGDVTYGEYCIRGLNYWVKVTDTAILTAHPDGLDGAFEFMMANKPAGMSIYGGISTYSLPGCTSDDTRPWDFADADGWKFIAAEAQHITSVTGNNVCVLENELALTPFHRDGKTIDFDKLGQSLGALRDTGIEFWWYLPSIQNNCDEIPDMRARSIEFVNTVATALPNCRFIVGYIGYLGWQNNYGDEVTRRQMMIGMLGQSRVLDYMFVTRDGYWYWDDGSSRYCHTARDSFTEIKNLSGASQFGIYPGQMSWVTVAREYAEGYVPGQ